MSKKKPGSSHNQHLCEEDVQSASPKRTKKISMIPSEESSKNVADDDFLKYFSSPDAYKAFLEKYNCQPKDPDQTNQSDDNADSTSSQAKASTSKGKLQNSQKSSKHFQKHKSAKLNTISRKRSCSQSSYDEDESTHNPPSPHGFAHKTSDPSTSGNVFRNNKAKCSSPRLSLHKSSNSLTSAKESVESYSNQKVGLKRTSKKLPEEGHEDEVSIKRTSELTRKRKSVDINKLSVCSTSLQLDSAQLSTCKNEDLHCKPLANPIPRRKSSSTSVKTEDSISAVEPVKQDMKIIPIEQSPGKKMSLKSSKSHKRAKLALNEPEAAQKDERPTIQDEIVIESSATNAVKTVQEFPLGSVLKASPLVKNCSVVLQRLRKSDHSIGGGLSSGTSIPPEKKAKKETEKILECSSRPMPKSRKERFRESVAPAIVKAGTSDSATFPLPTPSLFKCPLPKTKLEQNPAHKIKKAGGFPRSVLPKKPRRTNDINVPSALQGTKLSVQPQPSPSQQYSNKAKGQVDPLGIENDELDFEPTRGLEDDDTISLFADSTILNDSAPVLPSIEDSLPLRKELLDDVDVVSNASYGSNDSRRLSDYEDSDSENEGNFKRGSKMPKDNIAMQSEEKVLEESPVTALGIPVENYTSQADTNILDHVVECDEPALLSEVSAESQNLVPSVNEVNISSDHSIIIQSNVIQSPVIGALMEPRSCPQQSEKSLAQGHTGYNVREKAVRQSRQLAPIACASQLTSFGSTKSHISGNLLEIEEGQAMLCSDSDVPAQHEIFGSACNQHGKPHRDVQLPIISQEEIHADTQKSTPADKAKAAARSAKHNDYLPVVEKGIRDTEKIHSDVSTAHSPLLKRASGSERAALLSTPKLEPHSARLPSPNSRALLSTSATEQLKATNLPGEKMGNVSSAPLLLTLDVGPSTFVKYPPNVGSTANTTPSPHMDSRQRTIEANCPVNTAVYPSAAGSTQSFSVVDRASFNPDSALNFPNQSQGCSGAAWISPVGNHELSEASALNRMSCSDTDLHPRGIDLHYSKYSESDKKNEADINRLINDHCTNFLKSGSCPLEEKKQCRRHHKLPILKCNEVRDTSTLIEVSKQMLTTYKYWMAEGFSQLLEDLGSSGDRKILLSVCMHLWQRDCDLWDEDKSEMGKSKMDKSKKDKPKFKEFSYHWEIAAQALCRCGIPPSNIVEEILQQIQSVAEHINFDVLDNIIESLFPEFIKDQSGALTALCNLTRINGNERYEVPIHILKDILRDLIIKRNKSEYGVISDYLLTIPRLVPRKAEEEELCDLMHEFVHHLQLYNRDKAVRLSKHCGVDISEGCCLLIQTQPRAANKGDRFTTPKSIFRFQRRTLASPGHKVTLPVTISPQSPHSRKRGIVNSWNESESPQHKVTKPVTVSPQSACTRSGGIIKPSLGQESKGVSTEISSALRCSITCADSTSKEEEVSSSTGELNPGQALHVYHENMEQHVQSAHEESSSGGPSQIPHGKETTQCPKPNIMAENHNVQSIESDSGQDGAAFTSSLKPGPTVKSGPIPAGAHVTRRENPVTLRRGLGQGSIRRRGLDLGNLEDYILKEKFGLATGIIIKVRTPEMIRYCKDAVYNTLEKLDKPEKKIASFRKIVAGVQNGLAGIPSDAATKSIVVSVGYLLLNELFKKHLFKDAEKVHSLLWKFDPIDLKLDISQALVQLFAAQVYSNNGKLKEALDMITKFDLTNVPQKWTCNSSSEDAGFRDLTCITLFHQCRESDAFLPTAERLFKSMLNAKESYKFDVGQECFDKLLFSMCRAGQLDGALQLLIWANTVHKLVPSQPLASRLLLTQINALPPDEQVKYTPQVLFILQQHPYSDAIPQSIEVGHIVFVHLKSIWFTCEVRTIMTFLLNCHISNLPIEQDIPDIAVKIKDTELPQVESNPEFPHGLRAVDGSVRGMEGRVRTALTDPFPLISHDAYFNNGTIHLDRGQVQRYVSVRRQNMIQLKSSPSIQDGNRGVVVSRGPSQYNPQSLPTIQHASAILETPRYPNTMMASTPPYTSGPWGAHTAAPQGHLALPSDRSYGHMPNRTWRPSFNPSPQQNQRFNGPAPQRFSRGRGRGRGRPWR